MLNHIVLNYLIIEGHAHAIESFGQELGLELGSYMTTDLALDEDAQRNLIKSSILEGQIPQAIGFLKRWFPQILDHGDYLVFQLLKLNVIEIIRSRQMPVDGPSDAEEQVFLNEILAYVKDNLLNRVKYNEDYFKELELTMALLCFNDLSPEAVSNPETSQLPAELVQLFDLRLRSTLATDINKAILSHSNTSIEDCDFSPASQLFTGMASSGTRGKPRQKGEPARPVSRVSDNESKLAKLLKLFEWTSNLMEQSKK
ncbi:hypothetical protein BABINDRAFT_37006 [Babjeviella inositovora NRRL Y-12698]|uniref:CTLH domain-containing protein n=1 Tax=Babjeviella inositovora NRRL Y-12698 TaxID=984486 RepID=A0A1E3QP53_9ASCO|nr:uncharacterized protein BABINDRAFT_37006 [Babjeviella inositovora NRRL Y-12698]ODQ79418.1 hypothetical protein BABINDRAFT_37006 [Babjeviella inositovora NRRL Y-12698]